MSTEDVVGFTCQLADGLLAAAVDAVLAVMFAHAYRRSKRLFLLLFAVAAFAAALMHVYGSAQTYGTLTHTALFPRFMTHVIAWSSIVVIPVAGIISFTGSVLLVRFILSQHPKI